MTVQATLQQQRQNLALGFFLATLGGLTLWSSMYAQKRIHAVSSWPSVIGKVDVSEVVTSATKAGRTVIVEPTAKIQFAYEVDDTSYQSSSLRVLPMLQTQDETADAIVAKYTLGSQVEVFYNPADPTDAVLQPIPQDHVGQLIEYAFYGSGCTIPVALLLMFVSVWGMLHHVNATRTPDRSRRTSQQIIAEQLQTQLSASVQSYRRPWHWTVRCLAVLIGGVIALFGILLVSHQLSSGRTESISDTSYVVSSGVMAAIGCIGGYLVWQGVTRSDRPRRFTA